jgi:hypothetical protein
MSSAQRSVCRLPPAERDDAAHGGRRQQQQAETADADDRSLGA